MILPILPCYMSKNLTSTTYLDANVKCHKFDLLLITYFRMGIFFACPNCDIYSFLIGLVVCLTRATNRKCLLFIQRE